MTGEFDTQLTDEEIMRERRRRQRIEEARREKRKQERNRRLAKRLVPPIAGAALIVFFLFAGSGLIKGLSGKEEAQKQKEHNQKQEILAEAAEMPPSGSMEARDSQPDNTRQDSVQTIGAQPGSLPQADTLQADSAEDKTNTTGLTGKDENQGRVYEAKTTDDTRQIGGDIISSNGILIEVDTGKVLAQKDAFSRIHPASMTKILTVLVAAEQIEEKDLDDTFTITIDITDYSYVNDCSNAGFAKDERVTVRDLFYGTILPSGADAAAGLAIYTAGSLEKFVDLMNKKLEELGLSKTAHFTNCVGIFDENHYCTIYDMAMILEAALDNELCREVLTAHTYTTSSTEQHPEGITISNWFLRRIEDKDTGGEILYGKTGYVVQSGSCAASYGETEGGKGYLCVTVGANSPWRCIYDHVALYQQFMAKG